MGTTGTGHSTQTELEVFGLVDLLVCSGWGEGRVQCLFGFWDDGLQSFIGSFGLRVYIVWQAKWANETFQRQPINLRFQKARDGLRGIAKQPLRRMRKGKDGCWFMGLSPIQNESVTFVSYWARGKWDYLRNSITGSFAPFRWAVAQIYLVIQLEPFTTVSIGQRQTLTPVSAPQASPNVVGCVVEALCSESGVRSDYF